MSSSRRDLTRRDVIRGGIAATALGLAPGCKKDAAPAGGTPPQPGAAPPPDPGVSTKKKKKILILGGTGFLGPKTIDAAVARGHTITIFNRGKREKFLPLAHQVEHLYGNRDPELPADDEKGPDGKLLNPDGTPRGLEQLVGRTWDVVIDNSGYFPRMVAASAQLLAKNASQYIFISSISAYADNPASGGDEDTKLATLTDPKVEEMGAEFQNYGGLKVLCEQAAQAAFPGRATIVRPGYIVGPGDPTDRFTYWPVRASRGGTMLAPGAPDDPLQWIDVRDLGEWLVKLAEDGTSGVFNAIGPSGADGIDTARDRSLGPPSPGRWGDVLQDCVAGSGNQATLEWVPAAWLEENGQGGEDGFPIWVAPKDKFAGFHRWSNERAEKAGLKFRPMKDTVKGLMDWYPGEIERRVRVTKELTAAAAAKGAPPPKGDPSALRAGPTAEREQELLAKWAARTKP